MNDINYNDIGPQVKNPENPTSKISAERPLPKMAFLNQGFRDIIGKCGLFHKSLIGFWCEKHQIWYIRLAKGTLGRKYKIIEYGSAEIKDGILSGESLSLALKDLFEEGIPKKSKYHLAVSPELGFVRNFDIPPVPKRKIKWAAIAQATLLMPSGLEGFYFGYYLNKIKGGKKSLNITSSSIPMDIVDGRYNLFAAAGIELESIVPTQFAYWEFLRYADYDFPSQSVLLVKIDTSSPEFSFFHNGILVFSRSCGESTVCDIRLSKGTDSIAEGAVRETMSTIEFISARFQGLKPELILVSGNPIIARSINENIEAELGIKTSILSFENSNILTAPTEYREEISSYSPALSAPIGAIIGKCPEAQFTPEGIRIKRQKEKVSDLLKVFGIVIGLIIIAFFGLWFLAYNSASNQLKALNENLQVVQSEPQYSEAIKQQDQIEKYSQFLESFSSVNHSMTAILKELSRIVPKGAYLTDIELGITEDGNEEDYAHIEGTIKAPVGKADPILGILVKNLETSPYFGNIDAQKLQTEHKNGLKVISFQVEAKLQ